MSCLLDNLLLFGRVLRRAGIDAHPERLLDLVDALAHVNMGSRDEVYYTCRALLVNRPEQLATFDRAFDAFWGRVRPSLDHARDEQGDRDRPETETTEPVAQRVEEVLAPPTDLDLDEGADADPGRGLKTWSDLGVLAHKDFAALTTDEIADVRTALARLVWNPGERRTRRWIGGKGPRLDLRRALAGSIRTGGDVISIDRRARRIRPRPLVLLCDVSGSMERYTRILLHFAHVVASRHSRVEAFLFSTELTRITRQLRLPRTDAALAAVSRTVLDWSGGTRIGAAVKQFHQRWSRRVLSGGAVVLMISDGWDRGDPAELGDQIARLQRGCHRLVWLNPLIGTPDYAPLTRGLQAALPFVDDFLPARTLNNLADLAAHLNAIA